MLKALTSIFLAVHTVGSFYAHAEVTPAELQQAEKIPLLSVLTDVPSTGLETLKFSFTKQSIPWWAAIVSSTAVTYHYDEDMLLGAQKQGRDMGIGNEEKTKTVFEVGPYPILRLPSDTGSTLYFLGDGWTHMGIAAGFLANGYFGDNVRPYNTSLQLVHGMVVSTFFNQFLKRTTGRESPSVRTQERGAWRPLPNPMEYGRNTSKYDAYPSGHVMTATLTFTVIDHNYPEYSYITWPLATIWVGALGWQMMNNGVHWASDYPLAIGMGIVSGKMAFRHLGKRHKKLDEETKTEKTSAWQFFPSMDVASDTPTMNALYAF